MCPIPSTAIPVQRQGYYPPNATGFTAMTESIVQDRYDVRRGDIADSMVNTANPPKPNYLWPALGLAVSALSLFLVCKLRLRPPANP